MHKKNISVKYLIHFEGTLKKEYFNTSHLHDCWQMEIIFSGNLELKVDNKLLSIVAPSIILIAPDNLHEFKYHKETKIISVRFNTEETHFSISERVLLFLDMEILSYFCNIFNLLLSGKTKLTNDRIIILENLIEALFRIHFMEEVKIKEISNPLIERAIKILENYPSHNILASELASKCACSQGYLLYLFKKEKGISLKKYINEERLNLIKKYLLYSDMSINEIAIKTDFPDIYALSRFFKNITKTNPTKYRNTTARN